MSFIGYSTEKIKQLVRGGTIPQISEVTNVVNPVVDITTETAVNLKALKGGVTFERLSEGTVVNSYGELETHAVDQERFGSHGMLIEPQATNLTLYSSELNNWVQASGTITQNTTTAPDGTLTADSFSDNGNAYITQTHSFVSGTTYTASCFVKQGQVENLSARIGFIGGAFNTNQWVAFDFDTEQMGIVDGTPTYGFDKCENGWYRIWCSAVADTTTTTASMRIYNVGDNSGSIQYMWGTQLEQGSIATSYIPTTTAPVTRSRDTIDLDPTNFPTITSGVTIHQKWYFDDITSLNYNGATRYLFSIGTGSNNRIGAYILNGSLRAYTDIGTDRVTEGALNIGEVDIKFVMNEADNILYINGIEVSRVSRGGDSIISSIIQLFIGRYLATGYEANAQHLFTKIYPKALTASECRL